MKRLLETMGLTRVQTYINSGNAVFESEEAADPLSRRIEDEVRQLFGVCSNVMMRTAEELEQIVSRCPYPVDAQTGGKNVHVAVMAEAPTQKQLETLPDGIGDMDEFHVRGREIYFLYRQSILDSKLANNVQKLGKSITTRNINTMNKLYELTQGMKSKAF